LVCVCPPIDLLWDAFLSKRTPLPPFFDADFTCSSNSFRSYSWDLWLSRHQRFPQPLLAKISVGLDCGAAWRIIWLAKKLAPEVRIAVGRSRANVMPPVSHPFKKGALIILMNYVDHAPPHVHVKYQGDVRGYRIEIRTRAWMQPGKELPLALKKLVETWIEAHEMELLEQWENARNNRPVSIVG